MKLITDNLLFFLDIRELGICYLLNKNWNKAVKLHLSPRIQLLIKISKSVEVANEDIIKSIENKRQQYYKDYNLNPPGKDNAISNINSLYVNAISELKSLKAPPKSYEMFVAPILILFSDSIPSWVGHEKNKDLEIWKSALKFFGKVDCYNKIANLSLETIPSQKLKIIEFFISNPEYKIATAVTLHKSLGCIVKWLLGKF